MRIGELAPVSYTHLDVYKRQPQRRMAAQGQTEENDLDTQRQGDVPVSYTHLDVYKRQAYGCKPSSQKVFHGSP